MNISFDYLMKQFLLNYGEQYNGDDFEEIGLYSQKRLSTEFRKILYKIAIKFVYDTFENEDLIYVVLSLNRVERIIEVFGLILGMSKAEIAFFIRNKYERCLYSKM